MLKGLGFPTSGIDDSVFEFVIANTGATADDVVRGLGAGEVDVSRSLERLGDLGIIAPQPAPGTDDADAPQKWRAFAPELTLGPLLAEQRDRLRDAEDSMRQVVDLYRRTHTPDSASELIELVEGRAAQATRIWQVEHGARTSIDVFQTGRNTVVTVSDAITDDDEESDDDAGMMSDASPRPTIRYRVIVDSDFLAEPAAVRALDERVAAGHEIRIVDEPLIKLAIADGEIGMMQVSATASVILRPPLVMLGTELFETTWRHARPYRGDSAQLSQMDRLILQFMLAGMTDTAAASQLGTSPRTVQRRLRALMTLADVSTRAQLGWYAMRHNWI